MRVYFRYIQLVKYIKGYSKLSIFQKIFFNILAPIRYIMFKKNFKEEYELIKKSIKKEGKKNV